MKKRTTKSISFLMEFIIVLFFFAISSAICVNVYANAERMNRESNDTKKALIIAQNFIESIDTTFESEMSYNQDGSLSTVAYNESYFVLEVEKSEEEFVFNASVSHDGETMVELPFVFKGDTSYAQ